MRQLQLARKEQQRSGPVSQDAVASVSSTSAASDFSRPPLPLITPPPQPSTSAASDLSLPPKSSDNVFMNSAQFQSLFHNLMCSQCKKQVTVNLSDTFIDSECSISCSCGSNRKTVASSVKQDGKTFTRSNLAIVEYSLTKNLGYRGLQVLSGVLARPVMHASAYEQHARFLYTQMNNVFPEQMSNTFTAVKKRYKQYGREEREDGVVDVDVTFDGTWMTRGHRSHIGIAFVLEADTRQVLDFEVLCNHCIPCSKERTSHPDTFQVTR